MVRSVMNQESCAAAVTEASLPVTDAGKGTCATFLYFPILRVRIIALIGLAILLAGCAPVRGASQGIVALENGLQTQPRSSLDTEEEKSDDEIAKARDEAMKAAAEGEGKSSADTPAVVTADGEQSQDETRQDEIMTVDEPTAARSHEELMATGTELYLKHYCGLCHTLASAGTTGTFGPSHDGLGPLLAERLQDPNYAGTATTPAEYLMESLTDPAIYIVPGYGGSAHPMPNYDFLPQEELDALVQVLLGSD